MTHSIITLAWLLLTLLCAYVITVRGDVIRNQGKRIDALRADLADALQEREEALRQLVWREGQIAGHIRDWELLMSEYWQLERGDSDAGDVIAQVEAWLLEERVS